jgi:hypothetical protein
MSLLQPQQYIHLYFCGCECVYEHAAHQIMGEIYFL